MEFQEDYTVKSVGGNDVYMFHRALAPIYYKFKHEQDRKLANSLLQTNDLNKQWAENKRKKKILIWIRHNATNTSLAYRSVKFKIISQKQNREIAYTKYLPKDSALASGIRKPTIDNKKAQVIRERKGFSLINACLEQSKYDFSPLLENVPLKTSKHKKFIYNTKFYRHQKEISKRGRPLKLTHGSFRAPRMSSYEVLVHRFVENHDLGFMFAGNKTTVGGKKPDFIRHHDKKIIECFCDYYKLLYWDDIETFKKEREQLFRELGYETLFLGEEDMTSERYRGKILEFAATPPQQIDDEKTINTSSSSNTHKIQSFK